MGIFIKQNDIPLDSIGRSLKHLDTTMQRVGLQEATHLFVHVGLACRACISLFPMCELAVSEGIIS